MSAPLPISLCVITRDAAAQLDACLASAAFADEQVVVDSGSADDTVEIARRRGARVIEQRWLGYGAQKNFAVAQATHDWVLCLDADERLSPELADSIRAAMAGPPAATAFRAARRNRFLGRWLRHGEGYPDWNLRLFDRRHARWTEDPVHEHVVADGKVARLAGDLLHESAESLEDYLAKQNRYTTLQAQAMHARGERATAARIVLAPLLRFIRLYFLRLGFLDGTAGFVHVAIGCGNSMLKYAKLRALHAARNGE
ncbi:MAG: glycosyltransferase family 2 protein [Betaproteobacteria bacterium]|nr:glycosyltransferase family 2 protein [Betaproteobacteria bacterium]MBL0290850.1 glycosyltransferase family 2 protein [Betaproteobacteria bacterium]